MALRNFFSENIILPLSDLLTGHSVYKCLRFLNKSKYWTKSEIEQYQNQKLQLLLQHCYLYVPYYNELFKKLKLKPEDIQTKNDLLKLPILLKQTIKDEGINKFTSTGISKKNRIISSSSGSTGEPLFYYNTKNAYSMNMAAKIRGWYAIGYRLGDKYVQLSQNQRNSFIKKLQDKLNRNLYLSTNPLTDLNFSFILNEIEKYKPLIIRCYPDPLLFLARYKQNFPKFEHKPIALATTGNTLFQEMRNEIENVFGCKIFDSYSSEGNSTVFECPSHTGYHSTEEYGISEIIDEKGNSITKGIGRLISTDLWNMAHPFIRYDTQDCVEVDSEACICGRQHLKILRILGRDNEILEMPSGRKFVVHNFTGFFQTDHPIVNRSIEQFQVIKRKSDVIFRLVVNQKFNKEVSDYLIQYWENELKVDVEIQIVENIPLTDGGKRKFIINEKENFSRDGFY